MSRKKADVAGLLREFAGACRDRLPNAKHLAGQVRAAVADSSEVETTVDPDGTRRQIARIQWRDESFQTDNPDLAARVAVEDLGLGFLMGNIDPDETARRAELLAARFGGGVAERADGGDYQPAKWFSLNTKIPPARLRQATSPKRQSMHVRTEMIDNAVCYSVVDAQRWWPSDMRKV